MTYGRAVPALTYTYTGLVNHDSSAAFTGSLATTATSSSDVGPYAITQGTLAATGNYTIGTFNPGTLTINAAPLTVTANNAPMTYGEAVPTLTGTLSGVVEGDGITASFSTTATSTSDVGTYPITATLHDPDDRLSNYMVTNTPGVLTITKANQTITWSDPSAIGYGTALGATQLDATVSVVGPAPAGADTYSPAAGTVLSAGVRSNADGERRGDQ